MHSKKIATIIYNEWTKETIFADCEFKNGKINQNIPHEPQVTDSGLAREHLMSGYEHLWNYYQNGIEVSLGLCNDIKSTIDAFEKRVFEEIDKEIDTSHGKVKLERKTRDKFYVKEGKHDLVPREFDFSLYVYPEILSEILEEIDNRNNGSEKRRFFTSIFGGHTNLRIGNTSSGEYIDKYLAFGDEKVMIELQQRVQRLLDDPKIRELVMNYNSLKSKLTSDMNIIGYDQGRKDIWKNVDVEGEHIKGKCRKCSQSYLDSTYPVIYKTDTLIQGNIFMGDIFENIRDSTIVNKSLITESFNKLKAEHGEETASALTQVAEFIAKSNNHAAGVMFNNFSEELNKVRPDKSRLKSLWNGVEKLLPSIATISGAVAKIVTLF
ncbi:MAG: hypothetical protein WBP64_11615 [Nitrososphaeraceae archaeon]